MNNVSPNSLPGVPYPGPKAENFHKLAHDIACMVGVEMKGRIIEFRFTVV